MSPNESPTAFERKSETILQKVTKAFALGFVGLVFLASIACVLACIFQLFL